MSTIKLSDYLTDLRIEAGVTLAYVAEKTGLSTSYLSELEKGQAMRPKTKTLELLANFYCCDRDLLFALGGRITTDVFEKMVRHHKLVKMVREYTIAE